MTSVVRACSFALLSLVCAVLLADEASYAEVTIRGSTMGTTYSIKLSKLPVNHTKDKLKKLIDKELELVNDQMSTYRPRSELSRFNSSRSTKWFKVSKATARVVRKSQQIGLMLDGAFDVTIGMVVNLWGFGPGAVPNKIPSDKQLKATLQQTGNHKVMVRTNPPALKKSIPSLYVDLSGIAKGYGVEQVNDLLQSFGSKSHMVEIGGEVATVGKKAPRNPWRIAIERPDFTGRRGIYKVVKLAGESLATSGDYRNFYEKNGKRFSHIIDPRTGRPIDHKVASVTVIADKCIDADAIATGMMVLGFKSGMKLAKKNKLAVFFLMREKGAFVGYNSPAFESYWKKG